MSSNTPTRTRATAIGATTTLLGGAGSALLLALTASPAGAATTWTVDTLADGAANATDCTTPVAGSCSLRDALAAAAIGDTVTFSPTLFTGGAGAITLTNGQLLEDGVNITGPGANLLTIDADGLSRVIQIRSAASGTTISGVTITHGSVASSEQGSGIYDGAGKNLILTNVVVEGNSNAVYGAVSAGNLTMTGSVVSNNTSYLGGGVHATGDVVTITGSTISGNAGSLGAGGIFVSAAGDGTSLSIIDSTISDNAGGSLGGGLAAYLGSGSLLIANSTFTGNTADVAGAIFVSAPTTRIVMSTISGNTATGTDSPLYAGAGVYLSDKIFPTFDLTGSIVSGNTATGGAPSNIGLDAGSATTGTIAAASALIGTGVAPGLTFTGAGLLRSDAPLLGPLADNGGPTKTMLPLAGSPVLNAGPSTIPVFPGNEFDQRGAGFLRLIGPNADIGAVEIQTPPEPVVPHFTG